MDVWQALIRLGVSYKKKVFENSLCHKNMAPLVGPGGLKRRALLRFTTPDLGWEAYLSKGGERMAKPCSPEQSTLVYM
jgi:hypothetical protein